MPRLARVVLAALCLFLLSGADTARAQTIIYLAGNDTPSVWLPPVNTVPGAEFVVQKTSGGTGSGSTTVFPYPPDTIAGATSVTLTDLYDTLIITSYEGQWVRLSDTSTLAPATTGTDLLRGDGSGGFTSYAGASCTNQFITGLSSAGAATCTTATLASAQFANQGTTTTLLHGNAAGNPSWAAVSMVNDVTGILGTANGGTGLNTSATGDDRVLVSAPWAAIALANGALAYNTTTDVFSQAGVSNLAASTSAGLRGVLSDETGTGAAVFGITSSITDDIGCVAFQAVRRNSADNAWECYNTSRPVRVGAGGWTNSTTSYTDITGLTWSVAASTNYSFTCSIAYFTAAAGTAMDLAINGPAAATSMRFGATIPVTTTTTFYSTGAAYDTTTSAAGGTTGVTVITFAGTFENGANSGTLSIRGRSTVAASAVTVGRGSFCILF